MEILMILFVVAAALGLLDSKSILWGGSLLLLFRLFSP